MGSLIVRNEEEAKKRSGSRVFRYSDNSRATERKKYVKNFQLKEFILLTF